LRERGEDLAILVQYYLRRFGRELGREILTIDPEAMARLSAYHWPGNIRELQSIVKQALLQARGSVLLASFLPELPASAPADAAPAYTDLGLESFIRQRMQPDSDKLYAEVHGHVDQFLLTLVLDYTGGNQHKAARILGIARQTLRLKLKDLGLHVKQSVESEDD
jgi:two-component system nitrogen regulation response regulator GlnG